MTIRKSKGVWEVGYKDTFSLDCSLSPIIYAAQKKFHDVLEERRKSGKYMGIPEGYMKNEEVWVTDLDIQDWLNDIKKMMYAFDPNAEPEIRDYNFSYPNMFKEENNGVCDFTCSNPEGRDAYREAMKEHDIKVKEGLKLFGEKYQDLWW